MEMLVYGGQDRDDGLGRVGWRCWSRESVMKMLV